MIDSIALLLMHYAAAFWDWFYPMLPVGIIGAWRWSVWLFRKTAGMRYKPMPTRPTSFTASVIVPVYNENPDVFRQNMESIARENPLEIIAVIDHTDKRCIQVFEDFAKSCPAARMIVTTKPGKRPALADGILAANGDLVALVDSDTIWEEGVLAKLATPFIDPRVGGVSSRQNVLNPEGLAPRLFDMYLDTRYLDEVRFLAVLGDAITCISGRTAVYRRSAVQPLVPGLLNEKFMGKPVISGDDKCLTHLVQGAGWAVRYQEDARVFTPAFGELKVFLKQRQRWSRNSWRADLKALFSRWVWKRPALAFHLLDRTFQPLTTLVSPAYFLVSLFYQRWSVVMVLLIWWFVSRAIKIYPSIRRDPKNWMLLPAYIFFSYFFAVIRIYTFFTMNQQGWITRWDASRMGGASQIWRAYAKLYTSYAATASVMLAMILWVGTVQANKLQTPDVVFAMESELPAYNYDDALVQINDLKMPVQLAGNAEVSDRVINYEMSYGESLDFVARRFGLEQDNIIAGQGGFARQERILLKPPFMEHAKWERGLRRAAAAETTSIIYDVQQETIIIAGAGQAVTIPDLYRTLNDEELMSDEGNGVYLLKKKLLVTDNAALIIESPGVNWLKIQSNARNESLAVVSVVGEQAGISIDGVKISSWDSERNDYDVKSSDGRAFVLIKNGRMDVMNSEISYLGHPILDADGRGGVYGLSWRVYDDTFIGRQTVTGQIANNRIHHNYFGLYTFAATSMTIRNNEIYENEQYGIDPHTGSNNLLIEQNYIHNNGNHGIVLSRDCFNNVIRYNRSEANRLHGVLLDRNSNHNEIYDNVFRDNFDGIGLWNSHNNLIYNNALSENRRGIRLDQDSHNNGIYNNRLTKNSEYGVYFYGGAFGNWLWENTIHHSEIGVYLRSSANTVLDNTLVENRYGIYLTESAKRNRVAQNQLHDYEVGLYLKTEPDDFLAENRFNGSMVENAHNLQITGAWHALGTLQ